MSLPITTKEDYKGRVRISTQKGSQFDEYIAYFERYYLKTLINVETYNGIKDNDPLQQKYIDLIDGVQYVDDCGDLIDFEGLKPVLLRFIYSKYNSDNFQTSIGGNVSSSNENSSVLKAENTIIVAQRYNEAVDMYKNDVYKFLKEFECIEKSIENDIQGAGFHIIFVDETKYIYTGDKVTIDNTEYNVIDVPNSTEIHINYIGTSGDFNGKNVSWKPFGEIDCKYIKYTGII